MSYLNLPRLVLLLAMLAHVLVAMYTETSQSLMQDGYVMPANGDGDSDAESPLVRYSTALADPVKERRDNSNLAAFLCEDQVFEVGRGIINAHPDSTLAQMIARSSDRTDGVYLVDFVTAAALARAIDFYTTGCPPSVKEYHRLYVGPWKLLRLQPVATVTSIHYAAARGLTIDIVRLVDAGADVEMRDDKNMTPLHVAAVHNQAAAAEILLLKDANPYFRDNQLYNTALHFACMHGSAEVVQVLLGVMSNLETHGGYKRTALHRAAQYGKVEAARLLLIAGAVVDATDNEDNTPLHLAVMGDHVEVAALLLENKANIKLSLWINLVAHTVFGVAKSDEMKSLLEAYWPQAERS